MTKHLMLQVCCWLIALGVLAQSDQDTKANNQQFSLNPNDIGALSNSVNLLTGQVGFPMTLASLSGRGGLNPQVVINYSSAGIQQQVETWNREAPTGVLGLGWRFDFPKIVSEHGGTATRHDDTFYVLDNGTSTELVCTDADLSGSNGFRTYETRIYSNWEIKYYYNEEKWEILQDNGMTWIYGDDSRSRSDGTIQYMITWGNWIGSSTRSVNQSEMAYIWNLSEVKNLWSDKMTYYYDNEEEEVGAGSLKHTKASYLSKIESPTGNSIVINYTEKTYNSCTGGIYRCDEIKEYQDPHEEKSEPDAYQEKYETRYMSSVEAYNEDENLLYTVNLSYGQKEDDDSGAEDLVWIGEGDKSKRLLTSIQKTNSNGVSLPKTEFKYNLNDSFEYGYLQQVSNSTGAVISYQYSETGDKTKFIDVGPYNIEVPVRVGGRNILIQAPGTKWMAPSLFYGNDYVVVLWREVGEINPFTGNLDYNTDKVASYIQVYQWEGEWVKYDLGVLPELIVGTYDGNVGKALTAKVTLQDDFFAIAGKISDSSVGFPPEVTDHYRMEIFTRDRNTGEWRHYGTEPFETADAYDYAIEHQLWSGKDYIGFGTVSEPTHWIFDWDGKQFGSRITRNYSGHTDHSFANASNWYMMQDNNYKDNNKDAIYFHFKSEAGNWVDKGILPSSVRWNSNGDSGDPDGTDRSFWYPVPSFAYVSTDHYGPQVIYWDRNFDNFQAETGFSKTSRNSLPTFVNPFMIGIDREGSFLLYRFDGVNWIEFKNDKGVNEETLTAHLGESHALIYFEADYSPFGTPTDSKWNLIAQMDGDISEWRGGPISDFSEAFEMYGDYAILGSNAYGKEPNLDWVSLDMPSISFSGYDRAKDIHSGAGCMFLWDKNGDQGTYIGQIRNGEIEWSKETYPMRNYYSGYGYANLIGRREFALFDRKNEHWRVKDIKLFRNSANDIRGSHRAVIVKRLDVNDGYLQLSRQYEYNEESARMAINGNYPLFNEVKVINGGEDTSQQELGYTISYFYNGKPQEDLAKVPADQFEGYDDLLLGSSYLTEHYNKNDQLVQSTEKLFHSVETGDHRIDMIRPVETRQVTYESSGTNSTYSRTVYNNLGLPTKTESDNLSSEDLGNNNTRSETYYVYYPTKYAGSNLQSEVIATEHFIGNENYQHLTSKKVNIWEEVNGVPRVTSSYALRKPGTNSSNFNNQWWSDPSLIPSTWRLAIKNNRWDDYGNVLETEDFRGDKSTVILNEHANRTIAEASFAGHDEIAYTSLEPHQSDAWSFNASDLVQDGFTGSHSISGNLTSKQMAAGDYILYYWYKDGTATVNITNGYITDETDIDVRQGWTLREVHFSRTLTGNVSFSPNGAKIDEIRIHPKDADMSTMVYDERYRVVAETDANMITTFYEYDDLDRRNVVRDMDGVIRTFYTYGFKKEN